MRKFLLVLLVSLLISFAFIPVVFAATNARTASLDKGIQSVNGVGDLSSGATQEIDGRGAAMVSEVSGLSISFNRGDAAVLIGAGTLKEVNFNGNAQNDYIVIYDNTSATGTPIADISVTSSRDSKYVKLDADIATGIYVDYSGTEGVSNVNYSVTYIAD